MQCNKPQASPPSINTTPEGISTVGSHQRMGGHLFKQINRRNSISKEEKSLIDVNGSAESEYPGFNYHRFVFFSFLFASAVEGFSSRPFIFHFFPNRTDLLVNTNNFFPLQFDFLVLFAPCFDSSEDIYGH